MNKKAIVIYVDNNPRNIEEFTWLFKTWILWDLYTEYDLVVYHNPEITNAIPTIDGLIKKPQIPYYEKDPFFKDYKFVNSFAMFADKKEAQWICENYSYVLKSDADVFLTKNLKGYTPSKILIGEGGYFSMDEDEVEITQKNLRRIRKKLGLKDSGINHVGASIFGEVNIVVDVVNNHLKLTKYVLESEWQEDKGKWPIWFRGVASMYAIHLVVNNMFTQQHIVPYALDYKCWSNSILSDTLHIHAWHTSLDFSKHRWFNGEYQKLECIEIPEIAKDYCLWIASNSLGEILKMKQK